MDLKQRLEQLKKAQAELPKTLRQIAKDGTLAAVAKAQELTPPTKDDLSGTNTRSGEMKAHWATDSQTEPVAEGAQIKTALANGMEYASYVNDGHRMDRHFVPGLYINPYSGLLEYDFTADVGIVVGTKTSYVPGLHITDAAEKEYRKVTESGMKKVEDLLK